MKMNLLIIFFCVVRKCKFYGTYYFLSSSCFGFSLACLRKLTLGDIGPWSIKSVKKLDEWSLFVYFGHCGREAVENEVLPI